MPAFPPDFVARFLALEKRVKNVMSKTLNNFGTVTDHFESGTVSITITVVNTPVSQAITFARPFAAAPRVFTNAEANNPTLVTSSASSITTTGCNINMNRTSSTGTNTVDWVAVL